MQKFYNFFVKLVVCNRYCNDIRFKFLKNNISVMLLLAKNQYQIILKINYCFSTIPLNSLFRDVSERKIKMEFVEKLKCGCTFFHIAKIQF